MRILSLVEDWPELGKLTSQMHVALVSLCKDESLTVVKNSCTGMGLDGWRRLNKEYEPNNPATNLGLLRKLIQPKLQPFDNSRTALETWEYDLLVYEQRSGDNLSDPPRRVSLHAMCPDALSEHLVICASRLIHTKPLELRSMLTWMLNATRVRSWMLMP